MMKKMHNNRMAITFHLYFKINNLRHYVILLVKVIETSETWNREKLQHDGNLNALKQLFLFFLFWNRSRSFLDRIEPSAKVLVFHPDGNRYAIILFEGQPLRPRKMLFEKPFFIVSSSGLAKSIRFFAICSRYPADFRSSRPLVRKMGETDCNG